MSDVIQKAIEVSRAQERFRSDAARRQKAALGDQRSLDSLHISEGKAVIMERRFREGLATLHAEVVALMPPQCECTKKWVCPHCLLSATLTSVGNILAGEGEEKKS